MSFLVTLLLTVSVFFQETSRAADSGDPKAINDFLSFTDLSDSVDVQADLTVKIKDQQGVTVDKDEKNNNIVVHSGTPNGDSYKGMKLDLATDKHLVSAGYADHLDGREAEFNDKGKIIAVTACYERGDTNEATIRRCVRSTSTLCADLVQGTHSKNVNELFDKINVCQSVDTLARANADDAKRAKEATDKIKSLGTMPQVKEWRVVNADDQTRKSLDVLFTLVRNCQQIDLSEGKPLNVPAPVSH